jgi:nucleotide-binding universal stress UspA family protein
LPGWTTRVLAVANVTAESEELLAELLLRTERGAVQVTLLVPVTGGQTRADAEQRLEAALERMREAGMKATGRVIRGEPAGAVMDVWRPGDFDEIVVSTLPTGASKWLQVDLPHRLERLTNALVTHVVAEPPRPRGAPATVEPPPKRGLLHALAPLGWHREPD